MHTNLHYSTSFPEHRGILTQRPATLIGFSWFSSVSPDRFRDIALKNKEVTKPPLASFLDSKFNARHSHHSVTHRTQTISSISGPSLKPHRLLYLTPAGWEEGTDFEGGTRGLVLGTKRALAESE